MALDKRNRSRSNPDAEEPEIRYVAWKANQAEEPGGPGALLCRKAAVSRKEMIMHWYLDVLKKYAVFEGRARRKEYWIFMLVSALVSFGLVMIDQVSGLAKAMHGLNPLNSFYSLAVLLPSLGVAVRRLHDIGRSGWWLLIGLIPLIGAIILFLWTITDSDSGSNAYGPNPKITTTA